MKDFDLMHERGFNLINDNPEMKPTLEEWGDFFLDNGIDPGKDGGFTFDEIYPVMNALYFIGVDTGHRLANESERKTKND